MRSSPFGLAKATEGNAWSTLTSRGRTRSVWRTRSALASSTHPKSRLRCSSRTSQRSARGCLRPRQVPIIELYRNNEMEEFNAQVNEVRDEISKVVILNDETWEGLRCRICPSCATAIPTCFCLCLECEAQLISTGRYYININSDDEEDNQNPNVSRDARRAQEEANHDAAAQGDDDEAEEVPGEDDDVDTQGYTSGYASEEEDSGWYYRDTDLASRDIIKFPADGDLP